MAPPRCGRARRRAACAAVALLALVPSRAAASAGEELARCALQVHDGRWLTRVEAADANSSLLAATDAGADSEGAPAAWAWTPAVADACGLAALGRSELSALLRGAWVSVLGDSVARLFYAALLRAAGLSPEQRVVVGHRSFEHPLAAGARGSFVWAPYQDNVTDALRTWHAAGAVPDIVVVGASLWHMLHVGDADDHTAALRRVAAAMQQLREARGSAPVAADRAGHARHRQRAPLFFWMSTTALVTDKLLTEEKRNRLTPSQVSMYDARVREEHLLAPDGPCVPLDVHAITEACGAVCTADGMHFRNSTYDVLVQQWANAVRLMRRSVRCVTATERSALLRSKLGLAALPSDALCEPVMRLEARERAARAKAEPEQPPAAELTDRTDSTDTNA